MACGLLLLTMWRVCLFLLCRVCPPPHSNSLLSTHCSCPVTCMHRGMFCVASAPTDQCPFQTLACCFPTVPCCGMHAMLDQPANLPAANASQPAMLHFLKAFGWCDGTVTLHGVSHACCHVHVTRGSGLLYLLGSRVLGFRRHKGLWVTVQEGLIRRVRAHRQQCLSTLVLA